jgi:hypothetical protein
MLTTAVVYLVPSSSSSSSSSSSLSLSLQLYIFGGSTDFNVELNGSTTYLNDVHRFNVAELRSATPPPIPEPTPEGAAPAASTSGDGSPSAAAAPLGGFTMNLQWSQTFLLIAFL